MTRSLLAATALAVVAAVGCKNAADEDDGPSFVPKAVAFEGKIDPKYVGDWRSADGKAELELDKGGDAAIDQEITAANGKSISHVKGSWLVSGGDLLFKYPEKSGGETTVKYGVTLSGKGLALKHGSTTTVYMRK